MAKKKNGSKNSTPESKDATPDPDMTPLPPASADPVDEPEAAPEEGPEENPETAADITADRHDGADGGQGDAAAPDPDESAEAAEKPKQLGTSKAVETMFKNAYRSELDMIALAATKANIMISLNGFIISALMISGAFIFASSPAFLLPAGVFLLTAACSIVFALLSASPERADLINNLLTWARAVAHRKAGLRDLRRHLLQARSAAPADHLNLLIYEDRVRLSRSDYWLRMQELIQNREQVYFSMSDQLYWLGAVADRKFRLLNLSYTVFRWGLLLSLISFIMLKSVLAVVSTGDNAGIRLRNLGIGTFEDIYEPSAVQQLPDGRLLVVEDEASRAMSVLSIAEDGSLVEDKATGIKLMRGLGRKLSDLEGLSLDDSGFVYAVTSHSLTGGGKRKADREHLLRFRISGASVGEISGVTNLRDALVGDRALQAAIEAKAGREADFSKLNIEGLSYHVSTRQLFVGLRGPKVDDKSLIVVIRNPDAMFSNGQPPEFGEPILLDLRGGGIRALSYDPVLDAFLIVNEIDGHDDTRFSQLWSWSGNPNIQPEPIALPDIVNLNNVESIDSISVQGVPHLLLMSDEGNEKKNEPARYMLLDYTEIRS